MGDTSMMKRLTAILLALCLALSFSGCKSKQERELEQAQRAAQEAREAADRARENRDQLVRDIERYQQALDKINGK